MEIIVKASDIIAYTLSHMSIQLHNIDCVKITNASHGFYYKMIAENEYVIQTSPDSTYFYVNVCLGDIVLRRLKFTKDGVDSFNCTYYFEEDDMIGKLWMQARIGAKYYIGLPDNCPVPYKVINENM